MRLHRPMKWPPPPGSWRRGPVPMRCMARPRDASHHWYRRTGAGSASLVRGMDPAASTHEVAPAADIVATGAGIPSDWHALERRARGGTPLQGVPPLVSEDGAASASLVRVLRSQTARPGTTHPPPSVFVAPHRPPRHDRAHRAAASARNQCHPPRPAITTRGQYPGPSPGQAR